MPGEAEIRLKAEVDAAIASLKRVNNELGNTGKAAKKQGDILGSLKGSWTEFNSMLGAGERVLRMVTGAYDKSIGQLIDYGREVRDVSLVTGQGAEQASRLLQVLDDFEITGGELTTAMRALRQVGINPTVDSLARMSDEYLKLNPGLERQNFLAERFGARIGARFANVMNQGAQAIRNLGTAVGDGLVLTEQELAQVEALRLKEDELNDSWTSLKNTLVMTLAGPAADVMTWLTEQVSWTEKVVSSQATYRGTWTETGGALEDIGQDIQERLRQPIQGAAEDLGKLTDALPDMTAAFSEWTTKAIASKTAALLWAHATADGKVSGEELAGMMRFLRGVGEDELIPTIQEATRNFNLMDGAVDNAGEAINLLPKDIHLSVTTHFYEVQEGRKPRGHWVSTWGKEGETKVWVEDRAKGGPRAPVMEVGEEGTEGIINDMVIPHEPWEWMKRSGVIPDIHAAAGYDIGSKYGYSEPTTIIKTLFQTGTKTGGAVGPGPDYAGHVFPGTVGGVAVGMGGSVSADQLLQSTRSAASQAAAEAAGATALAAVAAIGTQIQPAISLTVSQQAAAQNQIQSAGNDRIIEGLGRIERELRALQTEIVRGIRDAVQQVI